MFDFCETLVDFQTADAFVHFIRNHHGNKQMNRRNLLVSFLNKTYIIAFLEKIFPQKSLNKRLVLWQLKGLSMNAIDQYANEYYHNMIKPHQIPQIVELLHELQSKGFRVVLVSGAYYSYLKLFAVDNGILDEDIISSRIGFNDSVCTGSFDGIDCMGKNKVTLLDEKYNKTNIYSISYSDSISDMPLLLWANDQFVISRNIEQKWAKKNSLKQIVWHQKDI